MNNKYDDIINLPHYVSNKHPQMTLDARAAQFAPFAALTGYEDAVEETARLTNERIELDDEAKNILDNKIRIIQEQIATRPMITFIYFVPDLKKDGGKYVKIEGIVKKIDEYKQLIILEDKTEIPINEIINISGDTIERLSSFQDIFKIL